MIIYDTADYKQSSLGDIHTCPKPYKTTTTYTFQIPSDYKNISKFLLFGALNIPSSVTISICISAPSFSRAAFAVEWATCTCDTCLGPPAASVHGGDIGYQTPARIIGLTVAQLAPQTHQMAVSSSPSLTTVGGRVSTLAILRAAISKTAPQACRPFGFSTRTVLTNRRRNIS